MMRSLSSAVSGLRAHQTKMDVIGNNIANVNTAGFKASRVTFSDVYYQTLGGGSAGSATRGGSNPTQIGYGANVATIDMLMTRAGGTSTNRPFDIYIEGDGFVAVQGNDGLTYYTRVGNLGFDAYGNLIDHMGNRVLGFEVTSHKGSDATYGGGNNGFWNESDLKAIIAKNYDQATTYDADGKPTAWGDPKNILQMLTNIQIGPDGTISGLATKDFRTDGTPPEEYAKNDTFVIGKIAIANFVNSSGLQQAGNSYYTTGPNSGDPEYSAAGTNGTGGVKAGYLEMSNVDLSQEFTDMIVTQRGFQANSRIITVSDEMLQELVNLKR